jgi:hypothetical protein
MARRGPRRRSIASAAEPRRRAGQPESVVGTARDLVHGVREGQG